jgi:hypothetical protein
VRIIVCTITTWLWHGTYEVDCVAYRIYQLVTYSYRKQYFIPINSYPDVHLHSDEPYRKDSTEMSGLDCKQSHIFWVFSPSKHWPASEQLPSNSNSHTSQTFLSSSHVCKFYLSEISIVGTTLRLQSDMNEDSCLMVCWILCRTADQTNYRKTLSFIAITLQREL